MNEISESKTGKLQGIGGWLAFFNFALFISGALSIISSTFLLPLINNARSDLVNFLWSSLIAGVVMGLLILTAAYQMSHALKWSSVILAICVIWSNFVLGIVFLTWKSNLLPAQDPPINVIISFLGSIIWTAYLLTSHRVANTYSKNGVVEEVTKKPE